MKKEIETLSNNNIDLNNLLPQIYKKYGINEINVNLLNVTKSLNFFIYQFTEIKSKLKYENFNFNGIISEINKIKIEDEFYLINITLENLLKIINNIINNNEIDKEEIVLFDTTKYFRHLPNAKNIISIIDADFMSSLQKLFSTLKEKTLKLSFPGRIIIPKKIIREITYSPVGITHPLSSRKLISYFSQQLNAEIIEVNIDDKKETIFNLWKKLTSQGNKASQNDEKKFINSGDMSILFLCCKLNPQPIVIFSNNKSEIETISRILSKENLSFVISVVNFDEAYSEVL